jgi:hypothetical protein
LCGLREPATLDQRANRIGSDFELGQDRSPIATVAGSPHARSAAGGAVFHWHTRSTKAYSASFQAMPVMKRIH